MDGWLFLGRIAYCGECAGRFLRELIRMGWTFPFTLTSIEPAQQNR